MPESPDLIGRPLEPDTGNAGVGMGRWTVSFPPLRISRGKQGCGFLFFMRLTVNGEIFDSNAGTIQELLNELRIEPGRVAVEVNLSIVRKVDYSTFRLNDEDKIEIVNFVGGG